MPITPFPGNRSFAPAPSWRCPSHSSESPKYSSASSSACSHALTTSGRCSISACGITMKPPSRSPTDAPVATLRARLSKTRCDAVGSQITAASSLFARNPLVITSMFWFRYSDGWILKRLNTACAKRSVQLPFGTATVLPCEPFDGFLGRLEFGSIIPDQENIALIIAEPEHRDETQITYVRLAGGHDARHIADIADVLLACDHPVHDDRALQTNLESDGRTLRQIFFVKLLVAHDQAGPRFGVVGLIADDEIDRSAWLAVVLLVRSVGGRRHETCGDTRDGGEQ